MKKLKGRTEGNILRRKDCGKVLLQSRFVELINIFLAINHACVQKPHWFYRHNRLYQPFWQEKNLRKAWYMPHWTLRAIKQIYHRKTKSIHYAQHAKTFINRPPIPGLYNYAHTRESRTKTDFVRELIPIQRTQLLANTWNRRGHKTAITHFKPTETF